MELRNKLLADIKAGETDTVITKNLSCLRRDYDASSRPVVVEFSETQYGYILFTRRHLPNH